MIEEYFKVKKTVRYQLSGPPDGNYKTVCFALHGYGQFAKYFIRNFYSDDLSDILFVAPEGFHRFYLNGTKGRVGASWMTKEDRLNDISDYCHYLDELYKKLEPVIIKADRVGILGFSQGVATACRWLTNSQFHFDFLVNWAGAFPPDLDLEKSIERMRQIKVEMLVGDNDEYITLEDFQKHVELLKERGYPVNSRTFKGEHKIYPKPLRELMGELTGL